MAAVKGLFILAGEREVRVREILYANVGIRTRTRAQHPHARPHTHNKNVCAVLLLASEAV